MAKVTSTKSVLENLYQDVQIVANHSKASFALRFFKAGPGEYAHGDQFLGLAVPQSRIIAQKYKTLPLPEIKKLLSSPIHEHRLIALIILVDTFSKADPKTRQTIFTFYQQNIRHVNNWDLVDTSADKIIGEYLLTQPPNVTTELLTQLADSKNLWKRRVAIIATFAFIKKGLPEPTLHIAKILLHDHHDLIHKAVGWMLREVGKRCSLAAEESFLQKHHHNMPRTMLRYAIEKFPPAKRASYMKGI